MVKLILLIAATLMCVRCATWYMAGKQYADMLADLPEKDYPGRELYRIGLAAQEKGLFRFQGKRAHAMITDATLIYGKKYAEFYARMMWAQGITLSSVVLTLALLLACNTKGNALLFAGVGAGLAAALFYNSAHDMKERLQKRQGACMIQFPDMASKLALLVNSGMVLREAWKKVAASKDGELYQLMRDTVDEMNNGLSDTEAIYRFGMLSNSPEIRKFSSAITQGLEKGNSELADSLAQQSAELWQQKRQLLLQRGEQAASKLLLPIGLLFVGILIMVMLPIMNNVL